MILHNLTTRKKSHRRRTSGFALQSACKKPVADNGQNGWSRSGICYLMPRQRGTYEWSNTAGEVLNSKVYALRGYWTTLFVPPPPSSHVILILQPPQYMLKSQPTEEQLHIIKEVLSGHQALGRAYLSTESSEALHESRKALQFSDYWKLQAPLEVFRQTSFVHSSLAPSLTLASEFGWPPNFPLPSSSTIKQSSGLLERCLTFKNQGNGRGAMPAL